MSLEQFLVETPAGEKIKLFAANEFDASRQANNIIKMRNSLVQKKNFIQGF